MAQQQNVLITGASSGIGKATAQLFAEKGFRVFGTSRQERPNEGGVEMLKLNVRSSDSVKSCVAEAINRAGQIDILVNNAGVTLKGFAEETKMEDAKGLFETNFFGVVRTTNAVLPNMRARRQGQIINVGSLASKVGEPGEAFYAASKSALLSYSEALHHEVWPLDIHVSIIEPGAFKTTVIENSSETEDTIPDYDIPRKSAIKTMRKAAQEGDDPGKVAHLILKIAHAHSPSLWYGAGQEAHWLPYLRLLLPQRLFDYLLRKSFGLKKI